MGKCLNSLWISRVAAAPLVALAIRFSLALHAQEDTGAPPANGPGDSVSFQTFYDSLANEGTWIQSPDYGYVWQPNVTDADWAPYTDGHWVYTQDGWTWVSSDPSGWATCHYGRWVNLDGTGWCWVPGYTWGPAWVSWRYGDGYCGWAPLPPDSLVGIDYAGGDNDYGDGFHIGGDCDSYYGIGAGWYNFLPIVYLGDSDYRGYYANRHNNYRLINSTTNVTNINVNRREKSGNFSGVSLGGPSILQANARSQTPIQRLNLASTTRIGGGVVDGQSLAIYAPRVDVNTLPSARPAGALHSIARTTVNRGTDLSRPLLVSSHLASPPPSSTEVHQAMAAQASAPANARLAGPGRPAASSGTASFTSMRPIGYSGSRAATSVRSPPTYSNSSQGYGATETYRSERSQSIRPNSIYSRPSGEPAYGRPSGAGSPSYRGGPGGAGGGRGGQGSGGGGQHR